MLTSASGGVTLAYDPALRLYQVASGSGTTRFAYDDVDSIAEYDGSNALQRRFVFGPGIDQPIVQYEGSGTTDRRFMGSDERGSIVSLTDSSGTLLNINRYDEYGKPQSTNSGRFQYTGQMWLSEAGLYYYKARAYLPHLGLFAQTDPIGYDGGLNLYVYVRNDPLNLTDPLGLDVTCTGSRIPRESCGNTPGLSCIGECNNFLSPGQRTQFGLEDRFGEVRQAPQPSAPFSFDLAAISACAADASACSARVAFQPAGILGDASEAVLNLRDFWAAGLAGEAKALELVTEAGYSVLGQQVYVQTELGLRITDILALNRYGGLTGFEVKTSQFSSYNSLQRQKDSYISQFGGTIRTRGELGGGLGYGSFVRYPTLWVYILKLGT